MQAVLQVPHRGYPKMVGKVFALQTSAGARNVFLHEEVSGKDQAHRLAESPGGLDWCLVKRLLDWKVETVFHKVRRSDRVVLAATATIAELGVRRVEDGRRRTYLPWGNWQDWNRPLVIPWIPKQNTVVLDPADDYAPEPEPVAEGPVRAPGSPRGPRGRRPAADDDERYLVRPRSQAELWEPFPDHRCNRCGRPTAQDEICVICAGEDWGARDASAALL